MVSGTAADPGTEPSGVSQVWVKLDNTLWQLASGTTSWSCNITNVTDGSRTISVYAVDGKGNTSTTQTVTITFTTISGLTENMTLSSAIRTYYSAAYGKTGSTLKAALNTIIKAGAYSTIL